MMEPFEMMALVAANGLGDQGPYTQEWEAARGLPVSCDRCGLPFDRTGCARHTPEPLRAILIADGRGSDAVNTHCPRFIADDELWNCDGMSLR